MHWIRLSSRILLSFAASALLAAPLQGDGPQADERERTLLFAGDIMLSRGVGARMAAKGDWTHPFHQVAETLRSADLTFGNLECPISDAGRERGHLYSFRADPRALEGLLFAGFDVVSLANNHAYDWGPEALLDTIERLGDAGIRAAGAGSNDREAHYPVVVDLDGVRVAFLAYVSIEPKVAAAGPEKPGVAWLNPERVLSDIRFARQLADIVVVSPHWGIEYAPKPEPWQVELARRMIDAGADLVVGHHPHVVQPVEEYAGGWIAYSLGNFVFDQRPPATRRGLLMKVTLRGKQIAGVTTIPTIIEPTFQAAIPAAEEFAGEDKRPAAKAASAPERGE
jgi:poly-gamma-glutamate synthesis protein (capsule biosynthesis protein)